MQDTPTQRAMLALRLPELPLALALSDAYAERFAAAPPLIAREKEEGNRRTLDTPSASFSVALSPGPIPWAELEGPCQTAWHWPHATRKMKAHAAHLQISASSSSLGPIDLLLSLTRVVAAAALITPAVGIYWPGATQVHDVKSFVGEALNASREQLPLYLWLRFGLAREDDGSTSLYTTGLAAFNLMEVELPHSQLDPQTLVDRAFNISHYLVDRGPVLEDGQTIGISADEKFEIRHAPSMWDAQRRVYSLKAQPQ